MRKVVIGIVAVVILLPVLAQVVPKLLQGPLTLEQVAPAFASRGFNVNYVQKVANPMNEAVAQISMFVNAAQVDVYEYDNEGKIVKNIEYSKPDAGSVIVESWNLSEQLGAAKPKNKPQTPARNGMLMLIVTSEDGPLRARIAQVFEKM